MLGICIKYFHENYGGMLQAYATTKMLEERHVDYEIIRYRKKITLSKKIRYIPRLLNTVLLNDKKEALLKRIGKMKHPEFAVQDNIRLDAFHKFANEHFKNLSPVYESYANLCLGATRYKTILTGSDQLWSPAGLPTNFYNLMFVPNSVKRVSYASSFGVNKIPWYQKKRTTDFLNRIDYISMRENRGKELVYELTGKHVPVVLDPVFLIAKEKWNDALPPTKKYDKPFIFAYFLGGNKEYRNEVIRLAQDKNLQIITLRHLDQYVDEDEKFGDYAPYNVGPKEFLDLIREAQFVCTDSFHGTAFSIIFNKEFVVFNRYSDDSNYSKNSRIETLCCNLGVEKRRYSGDIERIISQKIDYDNVNTKLEKLLTISKEYLDKILEDC
ncbi:MAG: polysaccharide pyruvyl transferase family protein [Lachnospiraceae bacterium]|nr:polysaccharide pyruvyl transferase family protein [Lachnospiraceae bacterium]